MTFILSYDSPTVICIILKLSFSILSELGFELVASPMSTVVGHTLQCSRGTLRLLIKRENSTSSSATSTDKTYPLILFDTLLPHVHMHTVRSSYRSGITDASLEVHNLMKSSIYENDTSKKKYYFHKIKNLLS